MTRQSRINREARHKAMHEAGEDWLWDRRKRKVKRAEAKKKFDRRLARGACEMTGETLDWKCETCDSRFAEYINGCPHCWNAGEIRSKVIHSPADDHKCMNCGNPRSLHSIEPPYDLTYADDAYCPGFSYVRFV